MSTIIEADAATLAGLQIDFLQKVRGGHITIDHIRWFNGLSKDARDAYVLNGKPAAKPETPPEPTKKFALLKDLGIMVVPADYVHGKQLARFNKEYGAELYDFNKAITDGNFPHPSRILKPGDRLHVYAYHQIVGGTTTSDERMAYLAEQKHDVYTGAQGATLVYKQKKDELPKGKWYASFDKPENLYEDSDRNHRVPDVNAGSGGGFKLDLGYFESVWYGLNAFFGFCDEKPLEASTL